MGADSLFSVAAGAPPCRFSFRSGSRLEIETPVGTGTGSSVPSPDSGPDLHAGHNPVARSVGPNGAGALRRRQPAADHALPARGRAGVSRAGRLPHAGGPHCNEHEHGAHLLIRLRGPRDRPAAHFTSLGRVDAERVDAFVRHRRRGRYSRCARRRRPFSAPSRPRRPCRRTTPGEHSE